MSTQLSEEQAGAEIAQVRDAHRKASYERLLRPLFAIGEGRGLYHSPIQTGSRRGPLAVDRFIHIGAKVDRDPIRLGIFAGLKGSDRHSPEALVQFLTALDQETQASVGTLIYSYPVTHRNGYLTGTDSLENGRDIFSELWQDSEEPLPYLIERELSVIQFHGVIVLLGDSHINEVSAQIYGAGPSLQEAVVQPALREVGKALDVAAPSDPAALRRYSLTSKGTLRPRPFEVVIKVPTHLPATAQIQAWTRILDGVLSHYRTYIWHGQNI